MALRAHWAKPGTSTNHSQAPGEDSKTQALEPLHEEGQLGEPRPSLAGLRGRAGDSAAQSHSRQEGCTGPSPGAGGLGSPASSAQCLHPTPEGTLRCETNRTIRWMWVKTGEVCTVCFRGRRAKAGLGGTGRRLGQRTTWNQSLPTCEVTAVGRPPLHPALPPAAFQHRRPLPQPRSPSRVDERVRRQRGDASKVLCQQKTADKCPDPAEMTTRPRGRGGGPIWKGLEATEAMAGWAARGLAATLPPSWTRSRRTPHAHAAFVTRSTKPNQPTQAFMPKV